MELNELIPLNRDNSLCFHLRKVIGRGAFSEIYEAVVVRAEGYCRRGSCGSEMEDNFLNKIEIIAQNEKLVALKMSLSDEDLSREGQILSRLNHPHVIECLFCLTNKEAEKEVTRGLVLEYLEGPDLLQLVDKEGNISEPRAASYAANILSALRYLGRSKVTHGDVNLYNMVLNRSGREVKLVDFGCARVFESYDHEGLRKGVAFDLECFGSSLMELMTSHTFETSRDHRSWLEMTKKPGLSPEELKSLEKSRQLFQPDLTKLTAAAGDFIRLLLLPSVGRQSDTRQGDRGHPTVEIASIEHIYGTFIGHTFLERSDNPCCK